MRRFTKEHSLMVKGVAVMLLLFYHLFHEKEVLQSMNVCCAPFSEDGFLRFAGFGNICVAIFAMLSTYGISRIILSAEGKNYKEIYGDLLKRMLKLMFAVVAVYVTISLICYRYFDYAGLYGTGKQSFLLILSDATGLSAVLDTPMVNATWWYMKLAYILILITPLLVWLVKKLGNVVLVLAFFAPYIICFDKDVERYLFVAVFGVCAAYGEWIEKIMNLKVNSFVWWILGIVGVPLCVLIRQNPLVKDWYWNYADAVIAFYIIFATVMTLGQIPILKTVLKFVGKHSMNIFLVHTFFYMIVWRKYIYGFEYAGITFLILMGMSLLYSVLLEGVKTLFRKIFKIFAKKLKKG